MIAVISSWWGVAGAGLLIIGSALLGVRVGEARERQHRAVDEILRGDQ